MSATPAMVQKVAGPQAAGNATYIKQWAKGWLVVFLPPKPETITISGSLIQLQKATN